MASLLLHPIAADWTGVAADVVVGRLARAGLLDPTRRAADGWYAVGDNFLSLVTFMGCAPAIRFEADPEAPQAEYCRVRVRRCPEAPCFVAAQHLPVPRCPACRAPVGVDAAALAAGAAARCPRCGVVTPIPLLNWKRAAGYARVFVEIGGVYPGEALPTDQLMSELGDLSGCAWRHFYA